MSQTCQQQEPASPCIGVCTLDETTNLCQGCFRTIDEIAGWGAYSAEEKRQVLTAIENRCERIMDGNISL